MMTLLFFATSGDPAASSLMGLRERSERRIRSVREKKRREKIERKRRENSLDRLTLSRRTSNQLPPLKEIGLTQLHRLDELGNRHRQSERDGLQRSSEVGDLDDGRRVEEVLAFDLDLLLDLGERSDVGGCALSEGSGESGRVGGFDGNGEGSEGNLNLVSEVELDSSQVTVEFRLDSDLDLSVFVEDSFSHVGESVEPLVDVGSVGEGCGS